MQPACSVPAVQGSNKGQGNRTCGLPECGQPVKRAATAPQHCSSQSNSDPPCHLPATALSTHRQPRQPAAQARPAWLLIPLAADCAVHAAMAAVGPIDAEAAAGSVQQVSAGLQAQLGCCWVLCPCCMRPWRRRRCRCFQAAGGSQVLLMLLPLVHLRQRSGRAAG